MKIIAATNNKGKIKEINSIFSAFGYEIVSLKDMGIEIEIEENGDTFEENALIKARTISKITNEIVIADDSGLCVDALGGEPGVYSARYAGENATDEMLIKKLLENMSGIKGEKRSAYFISALALVLPDGREFCTFGRADGYITKEPEGSGGFGYDPIFMCAQTHKTYAKMSAEEKNKVSHRYRALFEMKNLIEREKLI